MKIFCLGSAGKISRESVLDLMQSDKPTRVTIGDMDEARGREVVAWLADDRVDFVQADVFKTDQTANLMRDYDLVMDGTPISINHESTLCIARAGVHGVNLNGTGPEFAFHDTFLEAGKTYVPGFGMTPGITNVMARYAHDRLESIDTIRISHGAFRPFAFSPAITETTRIEYEPGLESRIVFEDGAFKQVEPFARPLEVTLPSRLGHTRSTSFPTLKPRQSRNHSRRRGSGWSKCVGRGLRRTCNCCALCMTGVSSRTKRCV